MTRFFVNNMEIAPPPNMSSLEEILKNLERGHLPPDSVIRQVQIDGAPLTIENRNESLAELLSQAECREKIEIFTGTMSEIARDAIIDAQEYLDRIAVATPQIAESFQGTPDQEGFQSLRQLYDGMYWLSLLMDKLIAGFQLNLEDVVIRDAPVSEHHQKFISVLKELIESQQKGDSAMISDLLEYEILPLVPIWKEIFGVIRKKANLEQ